MVMKTNNNKLLEMKAEIFQAIGHPVRLAIVQLLGSGEMCVCDIAQNVGTERSNCSRHLSVMLKAGVLAVRKEGLKMIYSLKAPCVLNFLSCVDSVLRFRVNETAELMEQIGS